MSNIEEANGVIYSSAYQTLISVPEKMEEIVINSQTRSIFGEKDTSFAFILCASTLKRFSFSSSSPLLRTIQPYSFYRCSSLEGADFSMCQNLTLIDKYAFYGCTKMSTLKFPNATLTTIASYSFKETAIQSIFFPQSLETIGSYSFHNCKRLSVIEFDPEILITTLSNHLFISSIVTKIMIPKNVRSLQATAFESCNSLESMDVDPNNQYLSSINGVIYSKSGNSIIRYPAKKDLHFDLPEGVTKIGPSCFVGSFFTSMNLPSTLVTIGSFSFQASRIKSIVIPNSVTSIEPYAFYYSHLNSVNLSNSLKTISAGAFSYCNLSSVVIPESIHTIGDICFQGNPYLRNVQLPSSVVTIGGGVFDSTHPNIKITFGSNSSLFIDSQMLLMNTKETIVNQYLGSVKKANITIPNTIEEIKNSAFYKSSIYSIQIVGTSELKIIGAGAFSSCTSLSVFPFTRSLTKINEKAFFGCSGLLDVTLFENIVFVGRSAFDQCTSMKNLTILSSNLVLPILGFYSCKSIRNISIGEGITGIEESCFSFCGFSEVFLPSSLKYMNDSVFSSSKVERVFFQNDCQIKSISDFCFDHCSNLITLQMPDFLVSLGMFCLRDTSIVEFILPMSIQELEESCFADCLLFERFIIPKDSRLSIIGIGVFSGCVSLSMIKSNCSKFVNENGALFNSDRTRLIAFPPASKIHFFSFPQSVNTVSQSAFIGCTNLRYILIPDNSVEVISIRAFENCVNLRTINIPKCVKSIGSGAFYGCKNLQCGIVIENRTSSFLELLVQVAKLSNKSLRSCECSLRNNNYHLSKNLIHPFIFFIQSTFSK